jgi:hypothetical protein
MADLRKSKHCASKSGLLCAMPMHFITRKAAARHRTRVTQKTAHALGSRPRESMHTQRTQISAAIIEKADSALRHANCYGTCRACDCVLAHAHFFNRKPKKPKDD